MPGMKLWAGQGFRLLLGLLGAAAPTAATGAERMIVVYDLTHTLSLDVADPAEAAKAWDEAHAVATLQGIVNRDTARLYIRLVTRDSRNIDDWWLDRLRSQDGWLERSRLVQARSLEELVRQFRDRIRGAVVYDPRVPATSNVASTVAGVEDLVAIRFDPGPGSVYDRLVTNGPKLPVIRRLVHPDGASMFTGRGTIPQTGRPSTGSAKCDAYLWAKAHYLGVGRCNPGYLGYYIDSFWIEHAGRSAPNHHTLTNHDFFVSKQAFFCDLDCWGDERPVDDPRQPVGTDLRTLKAILRSLYDAGGRESMIHVGGFTPWAFKYTTHGQAGGTHEPVATEWELVRVVSAYNGFLDADAISLGAMANASFFGHYPLRARYPQAERPTVETLRSLGLLQADGRVAFNGRQFIIFYVGDYDSAAWLYQRIPDLWEDPARGTVPLAWAISPALDRRAPMAMDYLRRTATPNDFFMAADNGAGYLNPSMLAGPRPISGLPGGLDAWRRHCESFYRRWDLSITGFIIDGHAPAMNDACLDAYAAFSPGGVVPQKVDGPARLHRGMPVLKAGPDIHDADPAAAARRIVEAIAARRPMRFHWFRAILKPPSWSAQVMQEVKKLDPGVVLLDPHTFFALLKAHLEAAETRE